MLNILILLFSEIQLFEGNNSVLLAVSKNFNASVHSDVYESVCIQMFMNWFKFGMMVHTNKLYNLVLV